MPLNPVPSQDILDEIRSLRREVAELRSRSLQNAGVPDGGLLISGTGGLRVVDADGDENLFIGGFTGSLARPDGNPQRVIVYRDDAGHARFAIWDPNPNGGDGYQQAIFEWDHLGNIVHSTDRNGGLARPWLQVHLYPLFAMAAGTFSYANLTAATGERTLWEGRATISHPWLLMDGVWGQASGTALSNTYRLKLNGTTVGTWTEASTPVVAQRGPFDVSSFLMQDNVAVQLTLQSSGSAGAVACQPFGCHLRQT